MRTRKLPMIKSYSQRLRTRLFFDLLEYQQQQEDQQKPHLVSQPVLSSHNQPQQQEEGEEEELQLQLSEQGSEEGVEQEGGQEFAVADYIQMLSPKEREKFKKQNPQLPLLFFMSRAQKKKYFEQLNKSFRQEISRAPQRKSKTKKILKFREQFQVKHFNEHERVVVVSKAKQLRQSYQKKIHFS